MNIFILDYDLETSAKYHCDQHVNKTILEAAQMICTIAGSQGITVPYKATHAKHPCTLWAATNISNYLYLCDYAFYLNEESKRRYDRKTDHKSWSVIESLDFPILPSGRLTTFAKAMPDEFKKISDPVLAYREYYKTKEFATWKTKVPEWYYE